MPNAIQGLGLLISVL